MGAKINKEIRGGGGKVMLKFPHNDVLITDSLPADVNSSSPRESKEWHLLA